MEDDGSAEASNSASGTQQACFAHQPLFIASQTPLILRSPIILGATKKETSLIINYSMPLTISDITKRYFRGIKL